MPIFAKVLDCRVRITGNLEAIERVVSFRNADHTGNKRVYKPGQALGAPASNAHNTFTVPSNALRIQATQR